MKSLRLYLSLLAALLTPLSGQSVFTESFTGSTADGWVFGGSGYSPQLTSGTIDPAGQGWLRLTDNAYERSTYALLDTQIFSVNAQISISMDYAFYDGTGGGADGITFFLVDGSVDSSSFSPGAYGGSLGYAQGHGLDGMTGGYLGFGFDNFGNYSNPTEDRIGGPGFTPNSIAVRGPESSDYAYINGANLNSYGQMDFPSATVRPDQTGADYRSFQIILDANNQLEVFMKFGASSSFVSVFTADLSAYDRPETFKLGFTGATGASTEIHEIRNLQVETTPWSSGPGAYEWDNGAGTTTWGTSAGTDPNNNWFSAVSGENNKTPTPGSDILFGNKPSAGPQVVNAANDIEVRNLTFDTAYDYTLQGAGVLTLGNTSQAGLPSINVNNYNDANARHKINNDISVAEALRINNYSFSTLCLNGTLETNGNEIRVNGYGAVNFNGDISGSGDLVKNGRGIVTINNDNSNDPSGSPSAWSGDVTINEGMVVVTASGALGNTSGTTTVNSGGTLAFRDTTGAGLNYTTTESLTIAGRGVERGAGQSAGAIYNDGGNNTFAGGVTLAANAAIGSRDGTLTLSGAIGQSGGNRSLTKVGEGVVVLGNTGNSYQGPTIIEEGVLRITGGENALPGGFATAAPSGGNLTLAGGVLEIGVGTNFTRTLGTGADQVRWTGDGGFSAFGGTRTVTLGGGTVTWGSGSFVPTGNALLLSSNYADSMINFTNAIALGSEIREIRVANGSAALDAELSGVMSGSGGINKTGDGTLFLDANNSYTGATRISGGALRYTNTNRINDSNVQLNGGVLEIGTGSFTRSLGTGASSVQWLSGSDGGFSASGGDRTVRLNNSTASITWGTQANFLDADSALVFGSTSADSTVLWDKQLNLNGGTRTIRVVDGVGAAERAEGRLTQALTNTSGGSLVVEGNGRLDSGVANGSLQGTVFVQGAELRLNTAGTMTAVSGFTAEKGGVLTLDNLGSSSAAGSGGTNITNDTASGRIGDSTTIALSGGTLSFLGASATSFETVGALTLSAGANTINVQRSGTNSSVLTAASLTRGTAATVDFTNAAGGGTLGSAGSNPSVVFTAAPTLTNGILAYATVNGTAFATYGANGITAAASADGAPWVSTSNVTLDSASGALGGATNREVNSVRLSGTGTSSVAFEGRNLDIVSGGVLSTGSGANSFTGAGTLTSSSGELIVHTYGTGGMNIAVAITNSGVTPVGLTKTGTQALTLSGGTANSFTGTTYVNAGTLELAKNAGITAIAGDLVIGDGRGVDTVRFINNEQLSLTSDVTLRGGLTGAAASANNVAVLDLNGTTQSFDGLTITGNSVIDFSGGDSCAPTFLNINSLTFVGDATLTIKNWIEFTDFFLIADTATVDFSRIKFEGYGGQAGWQDYSTGWKQITPVPEPATYGVFFLGGSVAFLLLRRRRRV